VAEHQVSEVRAAQYSIEIHIKGTRQRVWRGLTDQLGTWWLPDFHMLGSDSLVTFEPHAGGRLFEQNGDAELLWYRVLAISPLESLSLVGHCTPEFGGPLTTMLTLSLREAGEQTTLVVNDALFGVVKDQQVESLRSGWESLFSDGLKRHVEANG